jgi:hypothetical protein
MASDCDAEDWSDVFWKMSLARFTSLAKADRLFRYLRKR